VAEHACAHRSATGDHVALGYCPPVVNDKKLWSLTLRSWWEDHFRRKAHPNHQWSFVDFTDGNVSLRKDFFLACGGYDEQAFPGRRQDWELGVRLLQCGARLGYYGGAKGWHHLDLRLAAFLRGKRQEGRADVALVAKHPKAISRLPIARLASLVQARPRVMMALLRHAQGVEPMESVALGALDLLEATRQRRRWRELTNCLIGYSYVLGVLDSIPDIGELRRFLSTPVRPLPSTTLWLDAPGPVRQTLSGGVTEVPVGYAGRTLLSVPATDHGGQFDWEAFVERAVEQLSEHAPLALALAAMDGPQRGRGHVDDTPF
jgi:hypothetical protein